MNLNRAVNTWGSAALGVVCVFLGIRFYKELKQPVVRTAKAIVQLSPRAAKTHGESAASAKADQPSFNKDPLVRLSLVKEIEGRSLPDIARNPFDFAPLPPPKPGKGGGAGASAASTGPPPPPPIPLKAFGYSVDVEGRRQAYLEDAESVYVVSKGSVVSKRFKVLDITPVMVEVQDASSGQKAEIPIPREQ